MTTREDRLRAMKEMREKVNRELTALRRQDFASLEGRAITSTVAAARYGVPQNTIYEWMKRGYVRILGQKPRRVFLLNEADVAFTAAVYHVRKRYGTSRGAPLLRREGDEWVPNLLERPFQRFVRKPQSPTGG